MEASLDSVDTIFRAIPLKTAQTLPFVARSGTRAPFFAVHLDPCSSRPLPPARPLPPFTWKPRSEFFSEIRSIFEEPSCPGKLIASASLGARAVCAMFASPAFQRGVSETNNLSGVPQGRCPCSPSLEESCEKKAKIQTGNDFGKRQTTAVPPAVQIEFLRVAQSR